MDLENKGSVQGRTRNFSPEAIKSLVAERGCEKGDWIHTQT